MALRRGPRGRPALCALAGGRCGGLLAAALALAAAARAGPRLEGAVLARGEGAAAAAAVARVRAALGAAPLPVVGLDCEWREVGFRDRNAGADVVQVAPTAALADAAVFHCENFAVPAPLAELLADPGVLKVVHGVMDAKVLWRSGVRLRGSVDLQRVERLLGGNGTSLAKMYQRLCGKTLSKVLQRSDWGAEQLSQEQVEYSARDAVAALEIMHSFKDRWMPRAADVGSFARMFEDSFEVDEDGDLQRAELSDARARVLGQQDLPGPTRRAVLESKSGRDGGGGRWARARTKRAAVKFYAVAAGHVPGVYSTREECRAQCENFYGARYKSFTTRGQAEAFVIDHG